MSNRIKGITIEIGGDTTKLSKALDGMDRKIRSSGAALKDLNKLLKLDPADTTLLQQKQDYLRQTVEATSDKLEKEKEALAQLKAANTTGEVTEEQRALEREIAETEQRLKSAQDELRKFGSVGAQQIQVVGAKVTEVGEKISSVGDGLTKYVTAPLLAVGAASTAVWKDVDDAMDTVITKTGATGDKLASLQNSVKGIATTIPVDFQIAADAVGEVSTRFGITGAALESLSTQFVQFAQVNNTDVVSSVDSAQKALSAFGLSAESAGSLLDVLNVTGQNTGVAMDTLLAGLIQNGTAFQEMGLSIEQSVAAMGMMEKSGANSETVMQGLRKALKNATADGIPLNQALSDLQDTIMNGKDGVDGLTAAYDLFGKSGDQIYGAVKNGTLDFKKLSDAAASAGGSVAKTFESTLDPLDQATVSMNKLKVVGADLVNASGPLLTDLLGRATDLISELSEKWSSLSPKTQETIISVAALAAAAGPVLSIGGKLVSGIGMLISGGGAVVGFISGTAIPAIAAAVPVIGSVAVAAAPFLIGGAIIAGIVAGGVYVVNHWDDIKAKAGELGEKISEKWTGIKDSISGAWDSVSSKTSEVWDGIQAKIEQNGGGIQGIIATASQAYTSLWVGAFTAIDDATGGKLSSALSKVQSVTEGIRSAFTEKLGAARDKVHEIIERIKGFFNFSVSLPHIPLPHFSIAPPGWSVGDLLKGKIPSLSINWYAKAMDNGMILNSPTIFGAMGGKLLGGGERGAEAVVGVGSLQRMIRQSVREAQPPALYFYFGDIVINGTNQSPQQLARAFQIEVERRISAYA